MAFTDLIDRGASAHTLLGGEVGALIPEDVSKDIMNGVREKSAVLQLLRHRDMGRAQQRLPVLDVLPTATWVTGDTGFKTPTAASWTNKYLNAEEVAAIAVIPEKVLDDSDYDLWGELKPLLEEAIAAALDSAVLFGTNAPAGWAGNPSIVPGAVAGGAAANLVVAGTGVDYAADINAAMSLVEGDGYIPTGSLARIQARGVLRGLRDTTRGLIFQPDNQRSIQNAPLQFGTVFNEPIIFSRLGMAGFATAAAGYSFITGDWSQAIIGIRQDITYKMLDQAVITDGATPPVIQYNLPQQDLLAMRVVARFAYVTPNPVNRQQPTAASRWPFAVVQQKATTGGE